MLAMLKDGWYEDEMIAAVVAVSGDLASRQRLLPADVATMVRAVAAKLAAGVGVGDGSAHPRQ